MTKINSLDKIKICIVDDDEFSLENISLSLNSDEYDIDATGNSNEAINLLQNNEYDVVIIDYKLLGTTGLDIIEKEDWLTSSFHQRIYTCTSCDSWRLNTSKSISFERTPNR